MRQSQVRDDVDVMVDQLLADPSQAETVKNALRARLTDKVAQLKRESTPRPVADDSDEDFWDNVPI